MTTPDSSDSRKIGLFGATSIGVGAIVGGGILALAGTAFAATGPSAMLAFALNGIIALLTALSFAEMASTFPESGGTYTFAKKVLTVQAAFAVGWVVWFASIVAAVLYALGFASFAITIVQTLWVDAPLWLNGRFAGAALAILAALLYTYSLTRSSGSGGAWVNVVKVLVFGVLIVGGGVIVFGTPAAELGSKLRPFFVFGTAGLVQAMGYTFIAMQGFDLIAAVAGEVRAPQRTIPRAMLASLGIALVIYLPLLFVIATVGVPAGESITQISTANPDTVVAVAAQNYLGRFGYWLVLVAGVLSMLSALQANLLAASRVAFTMARDRTLSYRLETTDANRGTPVAAVLATAAIVIFLIIALPDVAAAGAASSLIFLITFALAHLIAMLMRRRGRGSPNAFRVPGFPAVPGVGLITCLGLAIFQGISVPAAGVITGLWLSIGGTLFLTRFGRRAQVVDAAAEARDPELLRLRGRSPLVLVPIANPANAASMVFVANALAPPEIGRVQLLTVVEKSALDTSLHGDSEALEAAQRILRESLLASFAAGLAPDALTTVATERWTEIARVAQAERCESLLLGLSDFTEGKTAVNLEHLANRVDSDVVVLRAPFTGWQVTAVVHILVPVGGQSDHDALRARLLSSLWRAAQPAITFLQIVPAATAPADQRRIERSLRRYAREEVPGNPDVLVIASDDVASTVVSYARQFELVVLGLQRAGRRRRVFGDVTLRVARDTNCGIIMISRK